MCQKKILRCYFLLSYLSEAIEHFTSISFNKE
jgi:hypothetical protein